MFRRTLTTKLLQVYPLAIQTKCQHRALIRNFEPIVHLSNVFAQSNAFRKGLHVEDLQISSQDRWIVLSSAGSSAKPLLKGVILMDTPPQSGEVVLRVKPERIGQISHEAQQALIDEEVESGDLNRDPTGRTVLQLVTSAAESEEAALRLISLCKLSHLQQQGFRTLSSGETRRVIIAMALATSAALFILDDPFAGLDVENQEWMRGMLENQSDFFHTSMTFVSHTDQVPDAASHVALLEEDRLSPPMTSVEWQAHPIHEQLQRLSTEAAAEIVAALETSRDASQGALTHGAKGSISNSGDVKENTLFSIRNGSVRYTERRIFDGLEWTIKEGEQWQVRGPNGCGKSSTLNLIFGDHPQCYSNDIQVLGFQRGSGESIWEVKKRMSMVSSQLHLQHRTNTKALYVVVSGLFDTIGLYDSPTKSQWREALLWLRLFQIEHLKNVGFRQLSYGQQRMLLIARALIKRPQLLLVDEPCQGLDLLSRAIVLKAMELIADHNLCTMVYVTHHKDDLVPGFTHVLDFVRTNSSLQSYTCEVTTLS